MMLLASCQRDELTGGTPAGEEVTVSISAVMPEGDEPVVRSATDPGDGSDVNRCIMSIYLADEDLQAPILYSEKVTASVSGKTAVFPDQRLVSGHKYRFVFWADYVADNTSETGRATDLNYDTQNFPTVSFKDGAAYKSNDDTRDAFFLVEDVTVSGPSTQSFELRRPFGQLNIITNDWGAIPEEAAAQLRPAKVKLTFNDVPNTIDLLTGEVSVAADLTGEAVEVSEIAQDGDAKHLSFDYILAKEGEQTILPDFTMDFLADDGNTKVTDTYTFTNIPVQRNYQTNVRGNLLTDRTGVEIEVVPEFDEEYNEIVPKEVDSEQALLEVLKEGGYAKLKNDITITGNSSVADGKEVALDLNNCTLTLTGTMSTKGVSSLTLINGTVKSPGTYGVAKYLVSASAGGSVALEHVVMESVGAGIGIEPKGDPGKVTVRNSKITAYSYAVGTNAKSPIYNAEIELINSQLMGMSAVLMNLPSKITVSKCVLQGSMQAMILRAGTAEITDSQLKLVYDSSNEEGDTPEDAKDNYIDDWLTGNAVPLAALTVGNDNSAGYLFKTELSLENVDIISSEESAPLPAMYVRANEDADKGVTITYGAECRVNGKIVYYDDRKNITINGTPVIVDADDDTRP